MGCQGARDCQSHERAVIYEVIEGSYFVDKFGRLLRMTRDPYGEPPSIELVLTGLFWRPGPEIFDGATWLTPLEVLAHMAALDG